MSELIRKKHNVSVLLYHLVCPTKYRKAVITASVDEKLKEICGDISLRYEIEFLEIGTDRDHVHFLVQSVPTYSAGENRAHHQKPAPPKKSSANCRKSKSNYGAASFGRTATTSAPPRAHASEEAMKQYVKNQGGADHLLQPTLF